jgi:hypothetical protein
VLQMIGGGFGGCLYCHVMLLHSNRES